DNSLNELECIVTPDWYYGNAEMSYCNLIVGNWYYIAVDARRYDGYFEICVDDQPGFDCKAGAITLTDLDNWCSGGPIYTNITATPDQTPGACWNDFSGTGNKNVWFSFTAISAIVTIDIKTSGGSNKMRSQNFALYDDLGSELSCNSTGSWFYGTSTETYSSLASGNLYYISVDGARNDGWFELCIDNVPDSIYWVGDGSTSNWSESDNWSDVSGGNGALTSVIPQIADYVFFDGPDLNADKNCLVDMIVEIQALQMLTGYPGSINMDGNNFTITGVGNSDFRSGLFTNSGSPAIFLISTTGIANFRGTTFGVDVAVTADIKFGGSTFNRKFVGTRTGSGGSYNVGSNTFNDDFEITAAQISGYFWMAGNDNFNGNLTINSTTNQLLVFQGSTLATSKTINIGSTGFATGNLQFRGFTQSGTTTQSFTLTGTATAYFNGGTIFDGDLTVSAPNLALHGLTANGTATFLTSDSGIGTGGNIFNSTCSISHSGGSAFRIGLGGFDIFNAARSLSNTGSDLIEIASSSTGNQFNGNVIFNSTSGYGISISGGGGSSTLASSATLTIGGSGFSTGNLTIYGLTQTGSGASIFSLTGSSGLKVGGNSIFNGSFTSTSPNVYLNGATFNGTTNITKTNGTTNINTGGNIFNGTTSLNHNGPWGQWQLATSNPDVFNSDVTFAVSGAGDFYPAYAQPTSFAGDISFNAPTNDVRFGVSGGVVTFNGIGGQLISDVVGSQLPIFNSVIMNNTGTGVTLNREIEIEGAMTFIDGVLYTTNSNVLTFADNATTSGVSNASFVDGPVQKIGNDPFTFPLGDASSMVYAIASISAPLLTTDVFTGSYFNENPDLVPYDLTLIASTIDHLSTCEYWIIDRTFGSSDVYVTLSWDSRSCGVTDLNDLLIARWDGSLWKDHLNGGTTGTFTSGTITTTLPVSSFSPFTLGSIRGINNPLPIELIQFTAHLNVDQVDLMWVTASETDNDYFTVEKSKNGLDFTPVLSVSGAGNSTQIIEYFDIDLYPWEGISYYRLKQTDFDGNFTYSNLVPVDYAMSEEVTLSIFPNPTTKNEVNLSINGLEGKEVLVLLRDIRGVEVYSKIIISSADKRLIALDLSGKLASGVYLVTASSENLLYSKKLIVK
ncbi:MAG: T9SS type A sorting domain-containing protein, partial [Flavobacteriales bacterium]|nr:T9SS type A sorting domain-containing protein [Flavobacteriales bacterium]